MDSDDLRLLAEARDDLARRFGGLAPAAPEADEASLRRVLLEVGARLGEDYPFGHPLYAGQMLKPPHAVARLAHALAVYLNPNNHALDGGRASSAMEKEAVRRLAALFGWTTHLGHLCSGGTVANLEALWVARETAGAGAVLASDQAHYTHERLSGLLGLPFRTVATDARGRMDPAALERALDGGPVSVVVATLGTTAAGAVDPLHLILPLVRARGVRLHVDAAYGGYFVLASNLAPATRRAFDAITEADSVVVDPHKHGLQPYGCGCVLFRDPSVGTVYRHESPYTYFTSGDLHLGEISLECSRPGAAAVALWATQALLPYERGGRFARGLEACREAALALHGRLGRDDRFAPLFAPELDIVVWAVRAASAREASRRARALFEEAARRGLHLALARMPIALVRPALPDLLADEPEVQCLRSCLMKPEHLPWLDEIVRRLAG